MCQTEKLHVMKYLQLTFVFFCLSLIILNPYTIYGKPGAVIAFILAGYGVMNGIKTKFLVHFLLPLSILMLISFVGVFSSLFNNIFQFNHLLAVISFSIVIFSAYGLWVYCYKSSISRDDVLKLVMYTVLMNSVVIVLELNFDSLRAVIESFLDPLIQTSIDYTTGYKFRGLASSGGAGLSISVPVALTIALYLFDRKLLTLPALILVISFVFFSVLVIGRTGLILSVIPLLSFLVFQVVRSKQRGRALFTGFVLVLVVIYLYQFTIEYFSDMFGDGFTRYAIGFLLEGEEGIKEEGTVTAITEYLTVLPKHFPQILFGYGFYGGSEFFPWTDSGLSRMFLSVGFVFGLLFYIVLFRMYFLVFKGNEFLIGTLVLVLAASELKEPLLYSGVASRMFIFVLVFFWCDRYRLSKSDKV